MSVHDTIAKAERWLEKLSTAYENSQQQEIEDILSTLLVTIRSIPWHLLEDYNKKYNLQIPLEERQFLNEFRKRANGESKRFIDWYDDEFKKLKNDPFCEIMIDRRDLEIHRENQKPDLASINITETIGISADVSVMVIPEGISTEEAMRKNREKHENEIKKMAEKKRKTVPKSQVTTDWRFQSIPDTNVLEASRKFMNVMKDLVEKTEKEFPQ